MYVIVDGPTLSLLLYSHFNSKGKEMGFLLGKKMEKVQSGITDSQMHTAEVHSYIYVTSFIPWPRHKSIYGRNGHIDESLMSSILEGSDEHVVGWYSFRHQTSQMPSMKEFSIHSKLAQMCQGAKPEDAVFFLCTSLASRNLSTHSTDHTFMVYRDERFMNIPMEVKNLGDTSRMEYIIENSSPATSKVINATMGNSGKNFIGASGKVKQVAEMKNLISSMTKGLESTQTKVNNSEAVLCLLETEVSALRDRVALLEKEEMQRAFRKAELQKQKEEEERKQREKNQEAEEEEQMAKLLMDLGLPNPEENGTGTLQPEQHPAPRPVSPIVSLPKLEAGINPLYVSTLHEFDDHDAGLGNFSISDDQITGPPIPHRHDMGKVQLLNNSEKLATASTSSINDSLSSKMTMQSAINIRGKPKDPFDFVTDEVKSELKVTNQGRQTRSILQHHSRREIEASRSPSPSIKASVSNKTVPDRPDAANANGHCSGDEHDGPGPSQNSSQAPGVLDSVTISSSPVF